MTLVDHHQCVVLFGKCADLVEGSYVAIHREYAIGYNDTETLCLCLFQCFFEFFHIRIGIAIAFRFGEANPVDNRGMIKGIRNNSIFFAEERFEDATIGIKASYVEDRVV